METTIQKGWSYISAIFQVLLQESEKRESLIEPQYIFRGITKRWFSTSVLIEKNKEKIIENILSVAKSGEEIKSLSKECQNWINQLTEDPSSKLNELESKALYEFMYERLKHAIKTEETKRNNDHHNKSFDLLNMIMQPPKADDKKSTIHNDFVYCVPEYINSGAVVRLKEGSPHPSNLDFVNYIKHMLNDLKIRFPEYNDEVYSDIEILADVQHRGAATCLADFSTNFLTTLWFATQEYDEEIGYLFCYDINKALIEDDKLFILNKNHLKRSIEELLYETSKGNKTYRNWLWQPSNLNERIAMQDSVFIFGLEPFKIEDNNIIAIPIPPNWKKPIQYVLRMFFGITAESVFCDVEGYSDANSKTRPYTKTFMHYFNDKYGLMPIEENTQDSVSEKQNNEYSIDYLQCGMDCLFQGEYKLALEYFKYYKAITGNDFKLIKPDDSDFYIKLKKYILSVEVMYSKAICLKHTQDEFGAIHYFENTIKRCRRLQMKMSDWINNHLIVNESLLQGYQKYLKTKQNKAFYDLINMFFTTQQYEKVIDELKKKIDELKKKIDELKKKNNNTVNTTTFDEDITDYLFYLLQIKEAQCCITLRKYQFKNLTQSDNTDLNEYFNNLTNWEYRLRDKQPLLFALSTYFDQIQGIMKNENNDDDENEYEDENENENENVKTNEDLEISDSCSFRSARSFSYTNNNIDYESPYLFANWDLRNMEKLIQEILDLDYYNNYKALRDQTDKIHDFITFIQSKVKSARS